MEEREITLKRSPGERGGMVKWVCEAIQGQEVRGSRQLV